MRRSVTAVIAGSVLATVGAFLFLTPYFQELEENYGLAMLFTLRGSREPPSEAVIINIDSNSLEEKALPVRFDKWSRSIHARLVDQLVRFGASVIVFDILFADQKDPAGDHALAAAIRKAGNVILVEDLQHRSLSMSEDSKAAGSIEIEQLIPPIDMFAESALGLAPFPLPKIPVRVSRSWRFKTSCGELPTLPVAAYQAATLDYLGKFYSLLRRHQTNATIPLPPTADQSLESLGLIETMRVLRTIFLQEPLLKEQILDLLEKSSETLGFSEMERKTIRNLTLLYGGLNSADVDFYGPPFTLPTIPYQEILDAEHMLDASVASKIRDRVVFIGAAKDNWSNQKDGFYTVFSRPDGLDISGVELVATVFSNVAENRSVRYSSTFQSKVIIFVFGMFCCLVSFMFTPLRAVGLLLAAGLLFLGCAFLLFSTYAIALPLVIPLMYIPPAAFVIGIITNYLAARQGHKHLSTALGYYVPENVVEELSKDLSYISRGDKRTYSTCLMTDAKNYTTLSERLSPEELSRHMKEYYRYLFREVKKKDGMICNVIGDSMLAHWPSATPRPDIRAKACHAALQISRAVDTFNLKHANRALPTRIGLHSGYLLLDNIGAEDHFEYAPVGDIVNTVSRIEGLNKNLGTQILASEDVVCDISTIRTRELGFFLLSGKTRAISVRELLSDRHLPKLRSVLYTSAFPEALSLFRDGKWHKALLAFQYCLILDPGDGPSIFYRQLCQSYLQVPPSPEWRGVVEVGK